MHDDAPDFLPLLIGDTGSIIVPERMPRPRGHGPKIARALNELRAVGPPPELLRPRREAQREHG